MGKTYKGEDNERSHKEAGSVVVCGYVLNNREEVVHAVNKTEIPK